MVGKLLTGGVPGLQEGMGCGRKCLPPNSLRSDQVEGLQPIPSENESSDAPSLLSVKKRPSSSLETSHSEAS